jgi:hypothetical protein
MKYLQDRVNYRKRMETEQDIEQLKEEHENEEEERRDKLEEEE